ncbi:hypothetical protein DYQ86_16620 [Acidobacteria bacterium AB60]|nr:hypothetical protein DYQ86_16620 [Acidobacteria bacterium AB60]
MLKTVVARVCACGIACAVVGGCSLSPIARHAAAFSSASSLVIESSEDAYRTANDLRVREQMEAAVYAYDYASGADLQFDPHKEFKPLFTADQLAARITVFDALELYGESLAQIAGHPSKEDTEALEGAAAGVGQNLAGLSGEIHSKFAGVPAITGTESAVISTALKALGEYLQTRVIKKSLPKVTGDMDVHVKALCDLLQEDIKVMKTQADSDYTSLLMTQNQFVLHNKLDAVEKRNEVEKEMAVVREQRANERLLDALSAAVLKLQLTHHVLAAGAAGNNPGSLKQNIADLQAAGKDLSSYYKSLLVAQ